MARVLADMAAIGIVNHGSLRQQEVLAQQLQGALNTRVIVEQAKGVVAERKGISLSEAFEYLRTTARSSQRPIADVALEVVTGNGVTEPGRTAGPAPSTPGTSSTPNEAPATVRSLAAGVPDRDRLTDPGPEPFLAGDEAGRDVGVGRQVSSAPSAVGLRERLLDPEPQAAGSVETAVELVGAVYLVNAEEALELLSEASRDLKCTLLDVAVQVLTDGRLPEEAILRARRQHRRQPATEEPEPGQTPSHEGE